ncbi:hypothetical protein Ngar_c17120 [Candidatus Nitrososphaera gargensis Ga9.2]|uniref:Uncharacterized protein n=1 Tax=Nitrososphaera gargensis (strain Ga9.2) TaxID=1237085 RepID=K0IFQ2_NITGG|nr:hypothetical protein [Candidatus Nitrososphaera gargensis]AFU58645.1 hypothetical protein Ngar_c17120 [Candidatus Nitrososphaera gargensis Ga9.2]
MTEVSGSLTVTFNVKNAGDLQRILDICKEFDGSFNGSFAQPMPHEPQIRQQQPNPSPSISKEETYDRIIKLLKSTFPRDGFAMRDAATLVAEKLHYQRTTVRNAITWARNKGELLKQGHGYYFRDFIQQQVAAKIQEQQQSPPPAANSSNDNAAADGNFPVLPIGESS